MSLLGLDVGTTGCKAAAFSADGTCLASAYREYKTVHRVHGEAELESRAVWALIKDVLTEVAGGTGRDPVSALSMSTMGESVTPVSPGRQILGNAILSSDPRGGEYVVSLAEGVGRQRLYEINPNIPAASYSLPKIMWLRDHNSALYRKTHNFLLWDGLVGYMLGCEPFASYSTANRTLLFDIRKQDWSDELIAASGIDGTKLPRCLPAGAVAGVVADEIAAEIGLPRGVKVVVGGHDQCCNALGAGIISAGRAVDGIGTFECITPVFDKIPPTAEMLGNGLNVEHHLIDGLYVTFLFNQAGSLVRWFRDTFAADIKDTRNVYDRLAGEMPRDPTSMYVLPYFEPTGSPGYVSDAAGVIAGLRTSTTRGEILKAIMESVTYYFVQSLGNLKTVGVDTSEFVATGGGARSDAWLQIKADIMGVPFLRPRVTECGVLGAAMLAGVATGVFRSYREAVDAFFMLDRSFEPDAGRHSVYVERAANYGRLFPLMHPFLSSLSSKPA